ncbi:MAG: glycosyltransferase [Actinomycetota bacterium]
MSTLVVTSTRVDDVSNGTDLRVAQLCGLIPDERHLFVAPLHPRPARPPTIDRSSLFASVTECSPMLAGPLSPRRHLRADDLHYLRRSRAQEFAATRRRLATFIVEHAISQIVVFGEELVELVIDIDVEHTVLDVCDSMALRRIRAYRYAGGLRGRQWLDGIDLIRARRTEGRLPRLFDQVVTASDADTAQIIALSGSATNVRTVPNGVDESYLAPMPPPATHRGVVFWGNLDFAPNADALAYFFDDVWFPTLRNAAVAVEVVGRNAPPWLAEIAEREPLVRLAGFVTDLRAAVSRYPVMVNPMQTGSGVKNKVLEAFGLGVVVVSTPRGVEALPGVRSGEHLVIAENSREFADAVLGLLDDPNRRLRLRANANALLHERYRWEVVGQPWRTLLATGDASAGRTRR